MKKNYGLFAVGIVTATVLSSCIPHVSRNLENKEELEAAIEKINSYDYKKDFSTMSLYSKKVVKEKYEVENLQDYKADRDIEARTNSSRTLERETVFRLDFSNENDLFYYCFMQDRAQYLTSFDKKTGSVGYEPVTVKYGSQFYQKNNKYYYQIFTNAYTLRAVKELELDTYAHLPTIKEHMSELEAIEAELSASAAFDKKLGKGISLESGKKLFNYYLMPIFENTFRINNEIIDGFTQDKTEAYDYSASETEFQISTNETLTFEKSLAKFDENGNVVGDEDVTIVSGAGYVFDTDTYEQTMSYKANAHRFWGERVYEEEQANREVNVSYKHGGWISSAFIDDERKSFEHVLKSDSIITTWSLITDFNVPIEHKVTEKV